MWFAWIWLSTVFCCLGAGCRLIFLVVYDICFGGGLLVFAWFSILLCFALCVCLSCLGFGCRLFCCLLALLLVVFVRLSGLVDVLDVWLVTVLLLVAYVLGFDIGVSWIVVCLLICLYCAFCFLFNSVVMVCTFLFCFMCYLFGLVMCLLLIDFFIVFVRLIALAVIMLLSVVY